MSITYIGCTIIDGVCKLCTRKLKYVHTIKENEHINEYGVKCIQKAYPHLLSDAKIKQKRLKSVMDKVCIKCQGTRYKQDFHDNKMRVSPSLCYACKLEQDLYNPEQDEQTRSKQEMVIRNLLNKPQEFPTSIKSNSINRCNECSTNIKREPDWLKLKHLCSKCFNLSKDPNALDVVRRRCLECNEKFERLRYEKFKKVCITCFKVS